MRKTVIPKAFPVKLRKGEKSIHELTENSSLSMNKARGKWNLPASSTVRHTAGKIVALRISGLSTQEIAEELKLKPKTVQQYLYLAAKNGWMKFEDPSDRLHYELAPKIVDNIAHHLNLKDKVMTIEAARGIGLFKSHQAIKNESEAPQMLLALKIEMPPPEEGVSQAKVIVPPGAIMCVPRKEE